ncbi:battenin family protein [Aspergillus candidus]|uniref:Protein BTN n=1 Tax=Aspergillus candidus TaxID=41067 RepID=A0A2I2FM02_ASPCN|nr:Golgi integral membrane protein [Aspergillus candidus]PLB41643.1 Golgi integral membrane protein [Aspergillus candidus]
MTRANSPEASPMLPFPGAPSSSWARFRERLVSPFRGADPRVFIAFWLFGVINNVLYVIILAAALDLVGPQVPKGVVLLADIVPGFTMKLVAPYFIHVVPYSVRTILFVVISAMGMLLVALTPEYVEGQSIAPKMAGIVLASLSSGGGEMSFLGLTHYYGPFSLAAWGSGTGAAGLVGAAAYTLATTSMGLPVQKALLASAFLPSIMLVSFFVILPRSSRNALATSQGSYRPVGQRDRHADDAGDIPDEEDSFLGSSMLSTPSSKASSASRGAALWQEVKANLQRVQGLFIPFMVPLLLVYIAEYTINQGVAPTLLFPLQETPFQRFRSFYPAYNATYQIGVFISRSSIPFFRVHNIYLPSLLQVLNLLILTLHALFDFIPSVYLVFAIIFWEGLLGGLVYVNTFAEIGDRVPKEDREFSLGATTVSDSAGICIAGFISMVFEVWLCDWQVGQGRDYCRKV